MAADTMEQLPRTQQSESAGYRDMGTDTSNGQIMLTRPRQARVITTLPLEIQSEILSHVSTLSDQISISQTCKLWQTIIWEYKSCQRQRYARVSEEVDIHKFIKYDKPLIQWLSCTFENGNVNQYRYKQTFAFVPADTTVRGLLQSIVEEIQPVMKKWEFDSSVEHELIFSSIRDLNREFEDDPIDIYLELKCDIPFIPGKDRSWVETTRSANDQSAASADA
ncbi:hypothetical protein TWF173_005990 [Orbilia oligospora]|nr:hypothetical protein TWF173_005990 [Orbilia oligospora]